MGLTDCRDCPRALSAADIHTDFGSLFGPRFELRQELIWSWLHRNDRRDTVLANSQEKNKLAIRLGYFVSYVSLSIQCVAQATALPTNFDTFLKCSVLKSNLYTAVCSPTFNPLRWFYPLNPDWIPERMWQLHLSDRGAFRRDAVSEHQDNGILNIPLYAMASRKQMGSISLLAAFPRSKLDARRHVGTSN
ncbi:hypothetical protein BCR34DRAFT_44441 [Clohesyomyces aquaticus]|uniref:Uncharacterized protein n=1 Tax=Clohesyomyces aquaticus TaxID=1231657 RepID=A0A1Y1Z6Z4_9PLEO|nr:hypothetical protein BCR34DRAFT_44441 [Clohesyomyces aquaticus]